MRVRYQVELDLIDCDSVGEVVRLGGDVRVELEQAFNGPNIRDVNVTVLGADAPLDEQIERARELVRPRSVHAL